MPLVTLDAATVADLLAVFGSGPAPGAEVYDRLELALIDALGRAIDVQQPGLVTARRVLEAIDNAPDEAPER